MAHFNHEKAGKILEIFYPRHLTSPPGVAVSNIVENHGRVSAGTSDNFIRQASKNCRPLQSKPFEFQKE